MSKQSVRKPLSIALGAALVTSLGATGVANAEVEEDIFAMDELSSGYLTAGGHETSDDGDKKDGEGKCGEGKCGEGKCGGA